MRMDEEEATERTGIGMGMGMGMGKCWWIWASRPAEMEGFLVSRLKWEKAHAIPPTLPAAYYVLTQESPHPLFSLFYFFIFL